MAWGLDVTSIVEFALCYVGNVEFVFYVTVVVVEVVKKGTFTQSSEPTGMIDSEMVCMCQKL